MSYDVADDRLIPLFELPEEWLDARRELPTGHFGRVAGLSPTGLTAYRQVTFGGDHSVHVRDEHQALLQLSDVDIAVGENGDNGTHRMWVETGSGNVWYPDPLAPVSPAACDPTDESTVVRYPTPVYLHEYVPFEQRIETLPTLWLMLQDTLDEPTALEEKETELADVAAQL